LVLSLVRFDKSKAQLYAASQVMLDYLFLMKVLLFFMASGNFADFAAAAGFATPAGGNSKAGKHPYDQPDTGC